MDTEDSWDCGTFQTIQATIQASHSNIIKARFLWFVLTLRISASHFCQIACFMLQCLWQQKEFRGYGCQRLACQNDWRVTGQLQADMYSATAEPGWWVDCDFFFIILPSAYKIFYNPGLCSLKGPSGLNGCKSTKRAWMGAYPKRRNTRCKLRLTQSEQSILHDLVLHLRSFKQWCFALLCCWLIRIIAVEGTGFVFLF